MDLYVYVHVFSNRSKKNNVSLNSMIMSLHKPLSVVHTRVVR